MTLPFGEPTWTVSQLCGEIRDALREVFPSIWVTGEVQRVNRSRSGHVYFELVEKDAGDGICGKLDAVLWRTDWQRVRRVLADSGQDLVEGMEVRVRGGVDFYGAGGRLQFVVREVDPVFTLGLLERRRRETLAALTAAGLLDVQRGLLLADLPLRIALVTSHGSAAYHDFVHTLGESGYGFQVTLVHASVQGRSAERELVSALRLAGRASGPRAVDCVVLIRGGGSRSDLAVFDSRAVAEAVARCGVPVLTGLGHEIDEAICDRVAHLALKTPTRVAEHLVERVGHCETAVLDLRAALARAALERLRDGREALGSAERGVELARTRLAAAAARLDEHARTLARASRLRLREAEHRRAALARRLAAEPPRLLARATGRPEVLARRLVALAGGMLRTERARVDGHARLARQLAPERTLARGYSITRGPDGAILTDAARARPGDRLTTRLASGSVVSEVSAPDPEQRPLLDSPEEDRP